MAQLDFARMQLHTQKHVLDLIISLVPMRTLMFDDCAGGKKYAHSVQVHDKILSDLNAVQ